MGTLKDQFEEHAKVSIAVLDSALTHLQEANKRLARLLALSIVITAVVICGALYFLMNYEIITTDVSIDSTDGAASYNYIGNDGDITNGAD